jgi:Tol biopolymer transport system component
VAARAPQATAAPKGPLPPPAGHIVFTRTRDNNGPTPAGISDIAILDVKTGEVRVVAQNGRQPDMRSDGRIVFNGEGGGRDDLQCVNPDGSRLEPVSVHPEDSAPDWSSGNSIAFHSSFAGPDRIFVQWNGDQRGEPQFLEVDNGANLRPFTGRYPVWVGGRIAYTGCDEWARRSICGIRIVDVDRLLRLKSSSAVVLITKNPEDRATDVSGNTILFSSPKSGNWDIYTVPADGGKTRALTTEPSQDLGGSYSPDGNYIAFMTNRGGWSIWIMEADGANPRQLMTVPEGFGKLWDQDRLSWGP